MGPEDASTCNQVALVDDTEMQVALINPDGIKLSHDSEKMIFARTLGNEGLQKLRKERRDAREKEKIDRVMCKVVRELSLEQQLRTILIQQMTLKDFEIDSFAGDGDRKAFLMY